MNKIIDLRDMTDKDLDNTIEKIEKEIAENQKVLSILIYEKTLRTLRSFPV